MMWNHPNDRTAETARGATLALLLDLASDHYRLLDDKLCPGGLPPEGPLRAAARLLQADRTDAAWKAGRDFLNLSTLAARLRNCNSLSRDVPLKRCGWTNLSLIVLERDAAGEACRVLLIGKEYHTQRCLEHQLADAQHTIAQICRERDIDAMTGLYNRGAAERLIRGALNSGCGAQYALVMIDIDNLKQHNDCLGHAMGDRAITHVARCIQATFRSSDISGRFGGDEFIVLVRELAGAQVVPRKAAALLKRVLRCSAPDGALATSCSVGIAFGTAQARDFDTLLRQADTALYCAKASGKSSFVVYDSEKHGSSVRVSVQDSDPLPGCAPAAVEKHCAE